MLFLSLVLSGLVWSSTSFAQSSAEACKALAKNIAITFPQGSPGIVPAGKVTKLRVKVQIKDQALLAPFPRIPLSFALSNQLRGSKRYVEMLMIKDSSPSGIRITEDFELELPFGENAFGHYQAVADFAFQTESGFCFAKVDDVADDLIVVTNTHEATDINAPIVTRTYTSKETHRAGEEMTIEMELIEKSPLCTEDLREQKICDVAWHISIVEIASGRLIDVFPPIKHAGAGRYSTSFELKSKDDQGEVVFSPGRYRVLGINIADKWSNEIHDLAKQAQLEFVVE